MQDIQKRYQLKKRLDKLESNIKGQDTNRIDKLRKGYQLHVEDVVNKIHGKSKKIMKSEIDTLMIAFYLDIKQSQQEVLEKAMNESYKMGMREFIRILCDKKLGAIVALNIEDKDIKDSDEFMELKKKYTNS